VIVEYCQVNALCFSGVLCLTLLGFAVAGIAAEGAPPANNEPSASTQKAPSEPTVDQKIPKSLDDEDEYRKLREERRRFTEQIDAYSDELRYLKSFGLKTGSAAKSLLRSLPKKTSLRSLRARLLWLTIRSFLRSLTAWMTRSSRHQTRFGWISVICRLAMATRQQT
jgi:hypothetical protein